MSGDRPLPDAVLADCLGQVVAEVRAEIQRELEQLRAETRATIAEIRLAAIEVALARHDPEAAARLRTITGGRS
jgi:hypothetical protein